MEGEERGLLLGLPSPREGTARPYCPPPGVGPVPEQDIWVSLPQASRSCCPSSETLLWRAP